MRELPTKETLTVEFKSDRKRLSDDDLVATAIAMANTEGGSIYLGVEDDGTAAGLHSAHQPPDGIAPLVGNRTVPSNQTAGADEQSWGTDRQRQQALADLPNGQFRGNPEMRWTAYRAAFMADDALRQHPDISWIFAARKCAAARLGAYRAAFRKRCGKRALRDRDWLATCVKGMGHGRECSGRDTRMIASVLFPPSAKPRKPRKKGKGS
jgi:hypothetical protein